MKRLILIKESLSIQTAHLYEHIFCTAVSDLFRQHKLHPLVDYSLDGRTYHGGIIAIDIELYTAEAFSVAESISSITMQINEERVVNATRQLLSEIGERFESAGYEKIVAALREIDQQPWKNIDDVDEIDVKYLRRTKGPLSITDGGQVPTKHLTTSVLLNQEITQSHRYLLPLFRQLSRLIITSFQTTIADSHGCFSYGDSFKSTSLKTETANTFTVASLKEREIIIQDVMQTCLKTITTLHEDGAFHKYMGELKKISYYDQPNLAPNIERNYEDTLIFIGSAGWKKIATSNNTKILLDNMHIQVTYGRQKVSATLQLK